MLSRIVEQNSANGLGQLYTKYIDSKLILQGPFYREYMDHEGAVEDNIYSKFLSLYNKHNNDAKSLKN